VIADRITNRSRMRTGIDGSGAERLAFEILAIGAGYAPLVPAAVRGARDPLL